MMQKEMYEFGAFSLDPEERVLTRDGTPLSLTPKAFDTLLCLVRNPARLLTKDELLKEIWPDTFVESGKNIRSTVRSRPGMPCFAGPWRRSSLMNIPAGG